MKTSFFIFFISISAAVASLFASDKNMISDQKGQPAGQQRAGHAPAMQPAMPHAPQAMPHQGQHLPAGGGGQRIFVNPGNRTPSFSRGGGPVSRPMVPGQPGRMPGVSPKRGHPPIKRGDIQQLINARRGDRPNINNARQMNFHDFRNRFFSHDNRSRFSARVRRDNPNFFHFFNSNFFDRRNYYPYYYYHGARWFGWPTWTVINNWFPYDWQSPIYYDDGGYPIFVKYEVAPPQEQGEAAPLQGNWLPLGVFLAAKSEEEAPFSTLVIQLAVNKEGEIAGTYYNATTDKTYLLQGYVDPKTQEASWVLADTSTSPLMTTGIFNLTQETVNVIVHFTDGTLQTWVLVRLDEEQT